MFEPLQNAFLRVDRADQHLKNLKRRIKAYVEAEGNQMLVRVEGRTIQQVGIPKEPPPRFLGILIGEAVQNLRTALDYLVFGLAFYDSRVIDVQRKTQFPIEDTPEGFERNKGRMLKGISAEHVAAIKALQPFDGGNWLSTLRDLSNLDKHNLLPVAAGMVGGGLVAVGRSDEETEALGGFRIAGDDVGVYYKFPVLVTFANGPPVVHVVEVLKAETRALLKAFEPEFEGWEERVIPPPGSTGISGTTTVTGPLHEG